MLGQRLKIFTDHKNVTYKCFNNYCLLQGRLILEEYGPYIQYILGDKSITEDAISRLPKEGIQTSTYESKYTTEIMSGLYDINKLPEGNFPLSFKIMDLYQHKDPYLQAKLKSAKYQNGYLCGDFNTT